MTTTIAITVNILKSLNTITIYLIKSDLESFLMSFIFVNFMILYIITEVIIVNPIFL